MANGGKYQSPPFAGQSIAQQRINTLDGVQDMVDEEGLSIQIQILQATNRTNELLEQLVGIMSGGTSQYDPQIMEAVFLLTSQPKSIMYGGKVAKKRIAEKVGCDVRKLNDSPTFMKALERVEGPARSRTKGHLNVVGSGKEKTVSTDAATEIDWDGVIRKLDAGESVNQDIDDLIGD